MPLYETGKVRIQEGISLGTNEGPKGLLGHGRRDEDIPERTFRITVRFESQIDKTVKELSHRTIT